MKNGLRRCDIQLTSTGNADDAVAEPLLKAPSYSHSQWDMRGLILSSFLKNVPKNIEITKTIHRKGLSSAPFRYACHAGAHR